jgi:hypothetical protein
LAAYAYLGFDPAVPGNDLARLAREYLSILSVLFSLWISGSLQAWRVQRLADGGLARVKMQSI